MDGRLEGAGGVGEGGGYGQDGESFVRHDFRWQMGGQNDMRREEAHEPKNEWEKDGA